MYDDAISKNQFIFNKSFASGDDKAHSRPCPPEDAGGWNFGPQTHMQLRVKRLLALASVSFGCALVSACGGSDVTPTSSLPVAGGVEPTTPPHIANIGTIDIPDFDGVPTEGARNLVASNDGVYMEIDAPTAKRKVIAKYTAGRGGPSGWITQALPGKTGSYSRFSNAPEAVDSFSIRWFSNDAVSLQPLYGDGNVSYINDIPGTRFLVASGADSTSGVDWLVTENKVMVRRRSGTADGRGFASSLYKDSGIQISLANYGVTSDESNTILYGHTGGSVLHRITSDGKDRPIDLAPYGSGYIHTLISVHGRLWIGYGTNILRLDGDKITPFATLRGFTAGFTSTPQFCINNLDLYTSDGDVYNGIDHPALPTPAPRSFLQSGSVGLSPDQYRAVTSATNSFQATGIYCDPAKTGFGPFVYTFGLELGAIKGKLFRVAPL